MPEHIDSGERTARKAYQCFDCYRAIPKGTRHRYFIGKEDGSVYTLRMHIDCSKASAEWVSNGYEGDYYDGVPPLHDMIAESGQWELEMDMMRGHYPHVVARLELNQIEAERRYQARLLDSRKDRP